MAKIGRNDPCPCGSGKKYKQCHGPIDAERAADQRQLAQAHDTLIAKIMEATPRFAGEFPTALERFWNGTHAVEAITELDDLEERGADRFLTWFVFDYMDADGRTQIQRLAEEPDDLELTPFEARLLPTWTEVHLRPYSVTAVRKGQGFTVHPLWSDDELVVEDHAAARRVEENEVVIVHLTPAGDAIFLSGAAAHLTPDTLEKLQEWTDLHLEDLRATQPDATYEDLVRDRSQIFNHFVMALPREDVPVNPLQSLIDNTRVLLAMRRHSDD